MYSASRDKGHRGENYYNKTVKYFPFIRAKCIDSTNRSYVQ